MTTRDANPVARSQRVTVVRAQLRSWRMVVTAGLLYDQHSESNSLRMITVGDGVSPLPSRSVIRVSRERSDFTLLGDRA